MCMHNIDEVCFSWMHFPSFNRLCVLCSQSQVLHICHLSWAGVAGTSPPMSLKLARDSPPFKHKRRYHVTNSTPLLTPLCVTRAMMRQRYPRHHHHQPLPFQNEHRRVLSDSPAPHPLPAPSTGSSSPHQHPLPAHLSIPISTGWT
jgi:hypothetical protein